MENCKDCRFCVALTNQAIGTIYRCCRHSPDVEMGWPEAQEDNGCGDFEYSEEAIKKFVKC